MHHSSHPRSRLILLLAAVAVAVGLVAPATASAAPTCSVTWGSLARSGGNAHSAPSVVRDLRAGRHECFDRLVVDLRPGTTAQAWSARYVRVVTNGETEDPLPLAGRAFIELTLRGTDAHDPDTGGVTTPRSVSVAGFRTFRQVVIAGDFEAVVRIGIGVRARLPYRVFVVPGTPGSGQGARVVLDVAHHW